MPAPPIGIALLVGLLFFVHIVVFMGVLIGGVPVGLGVGVTELDPSVTPTTPAEQHDGAPGLVAHPLGIARLAIVPGPYKQAVTGSIPVAPTDGL